MGFDESNWVARLFEAIDARDLERFSSFLDPQVIFRFGNAKPAYGLDATREVAVGFFSSVTALRHRLDDVWPIEGQDTVICRGEVCYTRSDGSELRVPFANVFRRRRRRHS